ncbi:MAG: ABC transporter permease subunit [Gammaproteobacteria bacterium]
MTETSTDHILPERNDRSTLRRQRMRDLKDRLFRYAMGFGGISVIIAILLIFFYLFYVVVPLFKGAEIEASSQLSASELLGNTPELIAIEEYAEIGLSIDLQGMATFFTLKDGTVLDQKELLTQEKTSQKITSVSKGDPSQAIFALGLEDGSMLLTKHVYQISFPNDVRKISPRLEFPLGEDPVKLDENGRSIVKLSVQSSEDQTTVATVTSDDRLLLTRFTAEESMLGDNVEIEKQQTEIDLPGETIKWLRLDVDQDELYVITDQNDLIYFSLSEFNEPVLIDRVGIVGEGETVTAIEFLVGGISILIGDSNGKISQWFPVRDDNNKYKINKVRDFKLSNKPITIIAPEHARKGFAAADDSGNIGLFHTTAHRKLLVESISDHNIRLLTVSPRANTILATTTNGDMHVIQIDNEHPEVSWNSLWGKVWYESRQQAEYIWQSSSASNDFEPKFSLTPLTFGTLKAAFYAMLFAVPLAIFGAIFTAYFMTPKMRNVVKPSIEIMEALPTVILGFLAGLWLAPLVEKNLPGVFLIFLLVPSSILLSAFLWSKLPTRIRHNIPDGWEAALLIPVVIISGVIAISLSHPVEATFFNNDMPTWVSNKLGLDFDQRNSLVVGIAMGFAVIPTIFSISEDAIFSVPKHLTVGSLALGATRWQTLIRVVLLTASPGIFSALMIGLGRAVGETMIVLMATGNTPIMDVNIFQGFRALSANIAVEMPESEVDSTHYRILFLAALVLFLATFMFNTIAELVRQRLREKYSSL